MFQLALFLLLAGWCAAMPNADRKEIGKDVEKRGVVEIDLGNNYSSDGDGFPSGGVVETVGDVGDSSSSPDPGSSDNYSPHTTTYQWRQPR